MGEESKVEQGFTEAHFAALGRIALRFGYLEWLVGLLQETLVGDRQVVRILAGGDTFGRTVQKVRSLVRHVVQDADLANEFDSWLGVVDNLTERRNTLLHSPWARRGDRADSLVALRWRKGYKIESYSIEDLTEIAEQVHAANKRGDALTRQRLLPLLATRGNTTAQNVPPN